MAQEWKTIKVSINKDETVASIIVPCPTGEGTLRPLLNVADARQALDEAGVVHGVLQDALESVFKESIFERETVVARGTPAENGNNAGIEYYFETSKEIAPKEDRDGRIDYKEVSLLKNVAAGDRLCRMHSATEGKAGLTVTGKKIKAVHGSDIRIPQGPGTAISKDDPNLLIATIDGCVAQNSGGLVEVRQLMDIKGDVDFSTGNIDIAGSLRVRGDIKSGFKVKVAGDLEVYGCVEDAEIEVKSNVIIKGGFIGRGNGIIRSNGNVTVKYVNNQQISCDGDLTVGGELMHCRTLVKGNVIVDSKKGNIIGGSIKAEGSICSTQIGSINYTPTEVSVGCKISLLERLSEIEKELEQIKINQEKVKVGIYKIARLRIQMNGHLTAEHETLSQRLQETNRYFPELRNKLEDEKNSLAQKMAEHQDCQVKVLKTIYPGARITIGNFIRVLTEQMDNKVFKEFRGDIIAAA